MNNLSVMLLGMTGFGNSALASLVRLSSVSILAVVTPQRFDTPFPYYPCPGLPETVEEKDLPLIEGQDVNESGFLDHMKSLSLDLVIVASFPQRLGRQLIELPRLGVINIHPSLLPSYRGATPTVWAILNGEKKTGVTAHFIEDEELDRGRIIAQASLGIEPGDTDGSLRKKLGDLSESVIEDAIGKAASFPREAFDYPEVANGSYFAKRTLDDAYINLDKPGAFIVKQVRAMTPYPGARLRLTNEEYVVERVTMLRETYSGEVGWINQDEYIARVETGALLFRFKENRRNDGK